jgi:glycosyltransferase involved in cell wall biosynthesis
MYIGNLAAYQGIDLLLESFALVQKRTSATDLAIVGGDAADIQKYQRKSRRLGIADKVHFVGQQPLAYLGEYVAQADILVSPRLKGTNTPMKVYSYLHSGKPILATDLPSHTQVLDPQVAMLVKPGSEDFARAMLTLLENPTLRLRLGLAGRRLVEERYTYPVFRQKVNELFDWLAVEVSDGRSNAATNGDRTSHIG